VSHNPLQEHTSDELRTPIRLQLLKVPPSPNGATLGTKPLTYELLGDSQDSNYNTVQYFLVMLGRGREPLPCDLDGENNQYCTICHVPKL
jgi:hypothetical protein